MMWPGSLLSSSFRGGEQDRDKDDNEDCHDTTGTTPTRALADFAPTATSMAIGKADDHGLMARRRVGHLGRQIVHFSR